MMTLMLMALTPGPAAPAPGKELKIQARAIWHLAGDGKAQQRVVRSAEELALARGMPPARAKEEATQKDVTAALARQLKVEDIDWKKQMIVIVTAGTKRTGGYSVDIQRLVVDAGTLIVHWKLNSPKPGGFVTQSLTHPAQAVLTERFAGKIKFEPPAAK